MAARPHKGKGNASRRSARAATYRKGSVYQDAKGVWWYQPPQEDGRRPSRIRCADRQAAELAQADYLAHRRAGIDTVTGAQSLATWLNFWFTEHAQPNIKPATARFYRQMLEIYVIPALGDQRLDRLNADQIVKLINQLRNHLAPRTVRHVYSVLHRALDRAVKSRKIPYNPADAVEPPKAPRRVQVPFTLAQSRLLLEVVAGHRLALLYHLTLLFGLRKGEALGLLWCDSDLDAGLLKITGQVQTIGGSTVRSDSPKSEAGRRTLPLPAATVAMLRAHQAAQREEALRLGIELEVQGLVFTSEAGTLIIPRNLSRHWYGLLRAAQLPQRSFHTLRHTAATRLDEVRASEAVKAAILGHGPQSVTGSYVHPSMEELRAAIEQAEALLLGSTR